MSAVEDTVKDIVVKIVHCEREILKPEATFQDMKADSLDMVQVLVALEDEFGIEIPDEDAQKFKNFGDFVSYVEARVAEKKGNA
ncbi:MAG TPA: acyl carrier protein [Dehalococcoidia bacterium]|nr:acyl carrier protein [Dehalococcoidia bacterium]